MVTTSWEKLLSTQALSCPTPSCLVVSGLLGTKVFVPPVIFIPLQVKKSLSLPLTAELIDATVKIKWLTEDYSLTLEFNLESVY